MKNAIDIHQCLTPIRANAYEDLFGSKPNMVFPYHQFAAANTPCLVDVLVYPLEVKDLDGEAFAAVTNGMSDFRMLDKDGLGLFPK
jgi:hypothetical protein